MHDTVLMQVVDGTEELTNDVGGLNLTELGVCGYTFIKSSTVHHLIDEVYFLLVLIHLDNLADIRVIQLLKEFNFFKKFASLTELKVLLAYDLDSSSDT